MQGGGPQGGRGARQHAAGPGSSQIRRRPSPRPHPTPHHEQHIGRVSGLSAKLPAGRVRLNLNTENLPNTAIRTSARSRIARDRARVRIRRRTHGSEGVGTVGGRGRVFEKSLRGGGPRLLLQRRRERERQSEGGRGREGEGGRERWMEGAGASELVSEGVREVLLSSRMKDSPDLISSESRSSDDNRDIQVCFD